MTVGRLMLNPFVLLGIVAAAPLIWSAASGASLLIGVQILVVALTVFAVWIGLASRGE